MYIRCYLFPRGVFVRFGRSPQNYRTIGIAPVRPFVITWKTVILNWRTVDTNEPVQVPFYF